MFHAIQRYDPLLMVNPQKHAPCANPVLVQIFEIFRHGLEGNRTAPGLAASHSIFSIIRKASDRS